jgi:hypothetical protein
MRSIPSLGQKPKSNSAVSIGVTCIGQGRDRKDQYNRSSISQSEGVLVVIVNSLINPLPALLPAHRNREAMLK